MVVRWTSDAVEARHQRLPSPTSLDFVGRHDPRAKATGADEILARRELVRVPLPIAHGAVIVAAIAEDVVEGLVAADVTPTFADHHREFAFEVELLGHIWSDHRLTMSHLAVCKAREDDRLRWRLASGFGDMAAIVEPDANDLFRIRYRGEELDLLYLEAGLRGRVIGPGDTVLQRLSQSLRSRTRGR